MNDFKKRRIIQIVICAILIVAGAVVGIVGGEDLLVLAAFLICLAVGFGCIMEKSLRKYCNKCGKSMKDCDYSYQEVSSKMSDSGKMQETSVHITAVCKECGYEKNFNVTLKCAPGQSMQYKVDKYCKKLFGY